MAEIEYNLFLSFARRSDEAEVVSQLGFYLQREVHGVAVQPIHVWQDWRDGDAAEAWTQAVAGRNSGSNLLMAFMTPGWFADPLCRLEAQMFQSLERQLGRRGLILPVHYLPTPDLDDPANSQYPQLAADLAGRAPISFKDMRGPISFKEVAVGEHTAMRFIAQMLAQSLAERLGRQEGETGTWGQSDWGRANWGPAISPEEGEADEPELEGPQLLAVSRPEEDLRRLSTREGADKIEEWFLQNFEPPENQTPREDGSYIYIWGGPYEAEEVIPAYFGELATTRQMNQAIELLERHSFEWAPHGSRVLPPEEDTWERRQTNWEDEIRPWNGEQVSAAQAHRDMLSHVEQVEAALEQLQQAPAGIGHNQPPESDLRDLSVSRAEFDDLKRDLEYLKSLSEQPERNELPEVQAIQKRTDSLGLKVAGWVLKKVDRFANAFVDEAGRTAGGWGVKFAIGLFSLDTAIRIFLSALGWPF